MSEKRLAGLCEPGEAECEWCADPGCGWRAILKHLDPEGEGQVLDYEARWLLSELAEGRGSLAVRGLLAAELVRWVASLVREEGVGDERVS
jgi:hypothetical protein